MGDGADELYRALGKALARWQYVETGMFLLFHGLSSVPAPSRSHSANSSARGTRPIEVKLKTLNKISSRPSSAGCPRTLEAPAQGPQAASGYPKRSCSFSSRGRFNLLPGTGGGGIQLGLSPQLLDLTKRKADGRVEALFMEEIVQAADEFLITARALIEFIETHVPT